MPIYDMRFEDGIFFAREVGRIDQADAELWMKQARDYANASPTPIVALVDAREVTYITVEARRIFVIASKIPNLQAGVVATQGAVSTQSANVIGMMAERGHTHIFPTLEEAQDFARRLVQHVARSG